MVLISLQFPACTTAGAAEDRMGAPKQRPGLSMGSKINTVHWVNPEAATLRLEPYCSVLNSQVTENQLSSCLGPLSPNLRDGDNSGPWLLRTSKCSVVSVKQSAARHLGESAQLLLALASDG